MTRHQYGISALVFGLTPVVALQNVGCLLCLQFGIGYSKKNSENYSRKCFLAKEKEVRVNTIIGPRTAGPYSLSSVTLYIQNFLEIISFSIDYSMKMKFAGKKLARMVS